MATESQITKSITDNILDGGRRTTASKTRTVLHLMNTSLQNKSEKDVSDGYLGIDGDGGVSVPGTLEFKNMIPTSATPALSLSTGAGTGASASIAGTNFSGEITLTTGTGCADDAVILSIIMDGFTFPTKVHAHFFPGNDRAILSGMANIYAIETTAGAGVFMKSVTSGPLQDSTTYVFHYLLTGY